MRSLSFIATFTLALAAVPALAHADGPTFTVEDHGDTVEVTATGLVASSAQLSTIRERIEIPLDGDPSKGEQRFSGGFIKVAETHGSPRVLSIKLDAERPIVRALMAHVTVKQDGEVLHVTIPKTVPVPAPVLPAADATPPAPVAVPAPPPAPEAEAAAKVEPATTDAPAIPPTSVAAIAPAPAPAPATSKPNAPAQKKASRSSNPLLSTPILGGLGLLALVFAAYMRRKRKQTGPVSTIEVIAQRSLGGKARVVWLTAGDREMVIAVTPQNVRMLGQWKKGVAAMNSDGMAPARVVNVSRSDTGTFRAYEPIPAAAGDLAAMAFPRASTVRPLPVSPAVSGILKLRDRAGTVPPPPMESDDGLDDDAIWARELLAATGGRR